MAFLVVAGVLCWLFTVGDPCLDTAISNQLTPKAPAELPRVPAVAEVDGQVVVDNPYGIYARATCDYWPTAKDHVVSASVLVVLLFGIGWFTARRVPNRAILTAAGVTAGALAIALVLKVWARFTMADIILLRIELMLALIACAVGAGIAMLGAWLSGKLIRRA
jgi:hypothetical protein